MRGAATTALTRPIDKLFQSTLPMRGAARMLRLMRQRLLFQSTLPMRGAAKITEQIRKITIFQSTLPMRGAAFLEDGQYTARVNFNPRSPCGERRRSPRLCCRLHSISIHAPHAGSGSTTDRNKGNLGISIHAPHAGSGGNPGSRKAGTGGFQSTLPMRGAAAAGCIHDVLPGQFQSTLPMRGAAMHQRNFIGFELFQSTLPMRGAATAR